MEIPGLNKQKILRRVNACQIVSCSDLTSTNLVRSNSSTCKYHWRKRWRVRNDWLSSSSLNALGREWNIIPTTALPSDSLLFAHKFQFLILNSRLFKVREEIEKHAFIYLDPHDCHSKARENCSSITGCGSGQAAETFNGKGGGRA